MIIGKMTPEGKTLFKPTVFMFGSMIFVNWLRHGLMIPMPEWLCQELLIWGFDPYGS